MRGGRTSGTVWAMGLLVASCSTPPADGSPDASGASDASEDSDGSDSSTGEPAPLCSDEDATDLFDKRIAPILADDRPKSCNGCHLAGIDLSLYVREDDCETMTCMYAEGIVDFDAPASSLVLSWIERGTPDSDGITQAVIDEEYAAMLEWIEYYAACGTELCEIPEDPQTACAGEANYMDCEVPPAFIDIRNEFDDPGDCSDATLEAMFLAKVYAWRGRCGPCHYAQTESPIDAPRWIEVGDCNIASLQTMHNIVDRGYLDAEDPDASMLLLKPLDEDYGGIEHGGDGKFHTDEEAAFLDVRQWIRRWAECQ